MYILHSGFCGFLSFVNRPHFGGVLKVKTHVIRYDTIYSPLWAIRLKPVTVRIS